MKESLMASNRRVENDFYPRQQLEEFFTKLSTVLAQKGGEASDTT